MLKITALAVGFLTIVTIAPARSTNFQIDTTRLDVNGQLHAERLVPIKKSAKLAPMVLKATSVKVPTDRKPELSPANKELKPVKDWNQQEFEDRNRNRFSSNERSINVWNNSANGKSLSGFGNFYNVNR